MKRIQGTSGSSDDDIAAAAAAAKSLQSWPTLCDPIDGSPPGSSPSKRFRTVTF